MSSWMLFGIAFAICIMFGATWSAVDPKRDCHNNGVQVLHGDAYHGSCN